MTEHQHTHTYPNEPVSPEIVDHPINKEAGGEVQTDDINVTLVAMVGIIAAILLFIIIAGLQAGFYTFNNAEIEAKMEPSSELAAMRTEQAQQLDGHKENTQPIAKAMDQVVTMYATARAVK